MTTIVSFTLLLIVLMINIRHRLARELNRHVEGKSET